MEMLKTSSAFQCGEANPKIPRGAYAFSKEISLKNPILNFTSHSDMTLKWTCKLQTFFFLISPLGGITLRAQRGMPVKICHQTPTVSSPAEYILLSVLQ